MENDTVRIHVEPGISYIHVDDLKKEPIYVEVSLNKREIKKLSIVMEKITEDQIKEEQSRHKKRMKKLVADLNKWRKREL